MNADNIEHFKHPQDIFNNQNEFKIEKLHNYASTQNESTTLGLQEKINTKKVRN